MLIRTTAAAWALALPAFAQHAGHTQSAPAPAPAAASARAPSAPNQEAGTYQSAFKGYASFIDQPVQDWKAANQRVTQIGGWRTYAAEAAGGKEGAGAHAGHTPVGQTQPALPSTADPKRTPGPSQTQPASPSRPASSPLAKPLAGQGHQH